MSSTIWIGNIKFGRVNVPVKLHSSVTQDLIGFHLLHSRDRVRLRQQMICAYDKSAVPSEEQVKGFPLEGGKYLLIDPEELELADPAESRDIVVSGFVKPGDIDPAFFERTYFLGPQAPAKTYSALAAALKEMNALGICTWTMRKRSYLGALQSAGKTLRLDTLRYADEIIQPRSLGLEEFPLSEKEMEIGSELINKMTVAFDPSKYVNGHIEKLHGLIDRKKRGEKITLLKPKHLKATEPGKLLEALKKSLKKAA